MKFKCGCNIDIKNIDIYNLPDCPETWSMLSNGNVKGIFQVESYLGKKWIKKLQPDSIDLLAALIAIIRPGVLKATDENGVSMTDLFCERRHGDDYEPIDPNIQHILEKTFGIIVFQEEAMQIAQHLCDFSLKETDELRRGMGKKLADVVAKIRGEFVDKAEKKGLVSREKAEYIYDIIEKSNRYNFNASHAVGYAVLGYITAWLKYHYPLEFYCGWLRHVNDEQDPQVELRELVQDARMNGIEINNPVLSDRELVPYIKNGAIYLGIGDIKGIGEKSAEKIINKISNNMSWIDMLSTIPSKQLENMVQAGCTGGHRLRKLAELNVWASLTKIEQNFIKSSGETNLTTALEKYGKSKKDGGCCANDNRVFIVQSLLKTLKYPPSPLVDTATVISKFEMDMLGVQLSCAKTDAVDPSLVNSNIKDIQNGKRDGYVSFEIEEIKVVKVKNGVNKGRLMAFGKVYDITGEIECVIFPDQYEEFGPFLVKGNTLVCKYYAKSPNSLVVNKLWQV